MLDNSMTIDNRLKRKWLSIVEWNQKEFQSSHYFAQSGEVENGARNMGVPHIGFMNLEGGILGKEKYTGMDPNAKTLIQVFLKETSLQKIPII